MVYAPSLARLQLPTVLEIYDDILQREREHERQFKALDHAIMELAVLKSAGLDDGLEIQGRAAALPKSSSPKAIKQSFF